MRTEVRVGEIVGYRWWGVDFTAAGEPVLTLLLISDYRWEKVRRAQRAIGRNGPAGGYDWDDRTVEYRAAEVRVGVRSVGYYAFDRVERGSRYGEFNLLDFVRSRGHQRIAFGSVRLWGTIIECKWGYQAEYAWPDEITEAYHAHRLMGMISLEAYPELIERLNERYRLGGPNAAER